MKCSICNRETPIEYEEDHHLIPKSKRGKDTIPVCCDCGDQIHNLFTNKELAKKFNTLEKLLESEKIQKWIKWISKKDRFGFCMKNKKKRL